MSIATVVTRGYGSFGSTPFVVRQGFNSAVATPLAPASRSFFWKAQDRLIARKPQDRAWEWVQQKRAFGWNAQNRTFVWPLEVTDVTATWPSPKDPGDISNWNADYTAEMAALSDTIATSAWAIPAALTEVAESNTDDVATIKLSGGVVGTNYDCINTITTTTSGETFERTHRLQVREVAS